jgi:hypothetical protein
MRTARARLVMAVLLTLVSCGFLCRAQEEPSLTAEQKQQFLLTAKVIKFKQTSKGVTSPYRFTLTDGTITHDAGFQSVDERRHTMQFPDGRSEINFVDSYLYNIAAYELAKLIGLEDMMPVTVARKWQGKSGALTWWLPVVMDEAARRHKKLEPPDPAAWNAQMQKVRVFAELVYDTDRNLGNVLIGKDWKIYMIDFTRAFRLYHEIREPRNLTRCSRELLASLRRLDGKILAERTKGYLNEAELQGVMKRRDKIVAHFEKLIAEQGENSVLY